MFLWCEWICKTCSDKHVARFDIVVQQGRLGTAPHLKKTQDRTYYVKGDMKIDDVAFNRENRPRKTTKGGGSKVYVPFDSEILRVIETVREYMLKYYTIKPDTLTLEVCSA